MYQEDIFCDPQNCDPVNDSSIALDIIDSVLDVVDLDDEVKDSIEEKCIECNSEVALTRNNIRYALDVIREEKLKLDLRKRI